MRLRTAEKDVAAGYIRASCPPGYSEDGRETGDDSAADGIIQRNKAERIRFGCRFKTPSTDLPGG